MKMLLAAALIASVLPISLGSAKNAVGNPSPASRPATTPAGMTYHGGWVMRTNTTFAIYWFPPGSTCGAADSTCSTYINGVDQYFKDVAAASGSHNNVYSVDTQYSDTSGPIAYQSTFGGAFIDEAPYPAYDPGTSCTQAPNSVCLTDPQVQAEVQKDITALGWPDGESSLFFLMVPNSVGECLTSASTRCVGCGNHGRFTGANSQPVLYAFIPYSATFDGCAGNPKSPSPNGDDADPAVNHISHEMNEAITNPWGDAWYSGDTQHGEIGDLCAWNFGNPLGYAANGQAYNQVINGHPYWLQQEWSNDGSHCLQRYIPGVDLPTSTAAPVVTGAAGVGRLLSTSNGTWTGSPTIYDYRWQRCAPGNLSSCADIPGATAATYQLAAADAGFVVRSEVSALNAAGASDPAPSAVSDVVVAIPASTAPPVLSGSAGVGSVLSTTSGVWNPATSTIAYQWLRCAADGSGCAPIPAATRTVYTLLSADAGHTLEARVSATDVAGTTAALSNRSDVVVAQPASTAPPRISGRARVGRKLKGSPGTWTNSPTGYRYQWLRCNKRGGSCRRIRRATRSTYRIAGRDAGHRIRLRVAAINDAGSTKATSRPTARVPQRR